MVHSHLPVRHLLRQLEDHAERRPRRKPVPSWLTAFVDAISELFEPFSDVARAGYECVRTEDRWNVNLFLGTVEIVGGPRDGQVHPVNFQFDLAGLGQHFERLDLFRWNAFPNDSSCLDSVTTLDSFITVEGVVNGEVIRLDIQALPPETCNPALRQYEDGSCVPV